MSLVDEVRSTRSLPPPAFARAIREAAGITQARLARELGVNQATVARWEEGTFTPNPAVREAYAALLRDLQAVVESAR